MQLRILLSVIFLAATPSFATTIHLVANGHLANDPALEDQATALGFPSGTPWSAEFFGEINDPWSGSGSFSFQNASGTLTVAGDTTPDIANYNAWDTGGFSLYNADVSGADAVGGGARAWTLAPPGAVTLLGRSINRFDLRLFAPIGTNIFGTPKVEDIVGLTVSDLGTGTGLTMEMWTGLTDQGHPVLIPLTGIVESLEITEVPVPGIGWLLAPAFALLCSWRRASS